MGARNGHPRGGQQPTLALVVGAARSGTTLLRLLLDAHPEIGCPAEAGVPSLMAHMIALWMTVDADVVRQNRTGDPGTAGPDAKVDGQTVPGSEAQDAGQDPLDGVPTQARDWIRTSVAVPMRTYNERGGKRLYVDKSLDSVYHLPLVHGLFPDTRCVLLFRHVMDTVASGLEASPWGFRAYGYLPYVSASPDNTVAALAQYWLNHVTTALAWEQKHPETCHRVRYEDLVLEPEKTLRRVERFLGVEEDITVLASAFDRAPANGPGDYKVVHTSGVHAGSIGHGKRVPVSMLPPQLRDLINEKLEALGYPVLTHAWNAEERVVDGGGGLWAERLALFMNSARLPVGDEDLGSFAVVAEDHRDLRWIIEPQVGSVTQGDGEVESVVIGTAEDLTLMLEDEENLGVLQRSGRVRHLTADEESANRMSGDEMRRLVTILRNGAQAIAEQGS